MTRSTESMPYTANGDLIKNRGPISLAAGTYYFPIGGADASVLSAHIAWDASAALTSVTIEDSNFDDAQWFSNTAGEWIDEDPTTAFVGVVSAGTTVTNGVVAHTAGAAGGAMFHVSGAGARRTRLKVVVGTAGVVRVAVWSKE